MAKRMRENLFPLLLFLLPLSLNLLNAFASSPPKLHPPEGIASLYIHEATLFDLSLSLSLSPHSLTMIFLALNRSILLLIAERALRAIAAKLGKANWDFGVDPCGGEGNWSVKDAPKGFESGVACDCSFANGSDCRIVEMYATSAPSPSISSSIFYSNRRIYRECFLQSSAALPI
ncbi:putative LRR receptor-like serine/threonine-protein kinase [Ananas comosus]|uniref:Putative LRR receptor-like serine/threonine-protein kinase n=1 Tax=Ananas comosus TaxID=4615 RepID=A0A199VNZ4_ANACO|nr:putative LRR receptor-like serine/threonine-protein kinase [Ananas comosus]